MEMISSPLRQENKSRTGLIMLALPVFGIAIKISIGKLKLHFSYPSILEQLTENNFDILPITFEDTLSISTLGFHHRDPFDRILIAQSINNKLQLITKDESFGLYNIGVIW